MRTRLRSYTGPAESSSAADVLGATPDFVGNLVATDGATSGEHFNIPVQAVDVFITMSSSSCGPGLDGIAGSGFLAGTTAVHQGRLHDGEMRGGIRRQRRTGPPTFTAVEPENMVWSLGVANINLIWAASSHGSRWGVFVVFGFLVLALVYRLRSDR